MSAQTAVISARELTAITRRLSKGGQNWPQDKARLFSLPLFRLA